jgi:hypothetical protein
VGRPRPRRTRAHQTSPRAETCSLPLSDGWPNLRLRARRTGTSQRRCSSARNVESQPGADLPQARHQLTLGTRPRHRRPLTPSGITPRRSCG